MTQSSYGYIDIETRYLFTSQAVMVLGETVSTGKV